MKYRLFKTAGKTARENNLIIAKSRYYGGNDLYYDFALFDNLDICEAEKDAIKADLMEHHAITWYEQPMPTICQLDRFTGYYGQIATAPHRVYKQDGKRTMIIIEVTAICLEKQSRHDVWSDYKIVQKYNTRTVGTIEADYEIA